MSDIGFNFGGGMLSIAGDSGDTRIKGRAEMNPGCESEVETE
jgi:hypothetical protein